MVLLNLNNRILISRDDPAFEATKDLLTIHEKEFVVGKEYNSELRRYTQKTGSRTVAKYLYDIDKEYLYVPYGIFKYIKHLFRNSEVKYAGIKDHPIMHAEDVIDNIERYRNILPGIELYDNQLEAIEKIFRFKRGTIQAGTGFGKTELMCASTQILKDLNGGKYPTILVLEPTIELLKGIEKRFKKYKIPVNNYRETRMIFKGKVNLAHPKSLCSDLEKDKNLLNKVEVQFVDECLSEKSRILLPDNHEVSIKEVYENPYITHVMSYNEEKNIYEKKKIIRKIRQEFNGNFYRIKYLNPVDKQIYYLDCTGNHKIWTENRGYVRCDELTLDDTIKIDTNVKSKLYICPECGFSTENYGEIGGHITSAHRNELVSSIIKSKYETGELKSSWSNPEIHSKAMKKRSQNKEYCKQLSERMKTDNPSFKSEIKEKIGLSIKKRRDENPEFLAKCLKNWRLAPLRGKHRLETTKLERDIISMNIPGLEYTGNGSRYFKFKNGKNKNPDFVFENGNEIKIVEVGDIYYWHTLEEIEEVKKCYKEIGLDCLYLTSYDMENLEEAEGKIRKFLFNHNVKILEILKPRGGRKAKYKYNLEVEDNHNYWANGLLVSNCHHVGALTFSTPTQYMENLMYSIGLSATFLSHYHVDGTHIDDFNFEELRRIGAMGPIIMKVDGKDLIENNQLATPKLCILHNPATEEIDEKKHDYTWHTVSKIRLQSIARTKLIAEAACVFARKGYKVIVLMNLLDWGRRIMQEIHAMGYGDLVRTCFGGQKYEKANRKTGRIEKEWNSTLDLFDKDKIKIIIGSSAIQEGIDLSKVDVCILAQGGKGDRTTLQSVGRALRKSKTGKYAWLVDIDDSDDEMLNKQFRERLIKYKKVLGITDGDELFNNLTIDDLEEIFYKYEELK